MPYARTIGIVHQGRSIEGPSFITASMIEYLRRRHTPFNLVSDVSRVDVERLLTQARKEDLGNNRYLIILFKENENPEGLGLDQVITSKTG